MQYAVLLNGDHSSPLKEAHQQGINRFVDRLGPFGFQTFLLAPEAAEALYPSEYVGPLNEGNLEDLAERLRKVVTPDDTFVLVTESHGEAEGGCLQSDTSSKFYNFFFEPCVDGETIADIFSHLLYRQRVLIFTQCHSGDWMKHFIDDPQTLIMTGSTPGTSTTVHFSLGMYEAPWDDNMTWRDLFAAGAGALQNWQNHRNLIARYVPNIGGGETFTTPPRAAFFQGEAFVDQGPSGRAQPPSFPDSVHHFATGFESDRAMENLPPGEFAIVGYDDGSGYFESLQEQYRGRVHFIQLYDDPEANWKHWRRQTASWPYVYLLGYPETERGIQITPDMTLHDAWRRLVLESFVPGWNPGGLYVTPRVCSGPRGGCFSGAMYLLSEWGPITLREYITEFERRGDPPWIASWDTALQQVIWQQPTAILTHDAFEAPVLCAVPVGEDRLEVTPEHRLLKAPGRESDWVGVQDLQSKDALLRVGVRPFEIDVDAIVCWSNNEPVYNLSLSGANLFPNYLISPTGEEETFIPAHNLKKL